MMWRRQPHNGLGSKPGKPVKKGDKKAEEKKGDKMLDDVIKYAKFKP